MRFLESTSRWHRSRLPRRRDVTLLETISFLLPFWLWNDIDHPVPWVLYSIGYHVLITELTLAIENVSWSFHSGSMIQNILRDSRVFFTNSFQSFKIFEGFESPQISEPMLTIRFFVANMSAATPLCTNPTNAPSTSTPTTITPRMVTSPDGSCVALSQYTCIGDSFGSCCSKHGYCGNSSDYCGKGCQPDFGFRCSQAGWCGSTNEYCNLRK